MKRRVLGLTLVIIALGLWACDSDSGDGGNTSAPDPDEGQTFTETITAAEGGTLATASGGAQIAIPAGALDADTEISIEVMPASGEAQTSIYEFGPDGTTFAQPVTISIKYDGSPGDDKKAVLAWHDGSEWVEVAGSGVASGVVSGDVNHFTRFTIILVGTQAVIVSDCADIATGFEPCGGDVKGTWSITDICIADTAMGSNPFEESCPEATWVTEWIWDGTVTMDGTTMTQNLTSMTLSAEITLPLSCLPPDSGCTELIEMMGEGTTCEQNGETCECTRTEVDPVNEPMVQTYSVDGNYIVTIDADSGSETRVAYCVQGDQLVSEVPTNSEDGPAYFYMVLTKQ